MTWILSSNSHFSFVWYVSFWRVKRLFCIFVHLATTDHLHIMNVSEWRFSKLTLFLVWFQPHHHPIYTYITYSSFPLKYTFSCIPLILFIYERRIFCTFQFKLEITQPHTFSKASLPISYFFTLVKLLPIYVHLHKSSARTRFYMHTYQKVLN